MAQDKHQSDQHYMEEELAQSQQDPSYDEASVLSAEQYASPESMHKRKNSHKGSKSITLGYKG